MSLFDEKGASCPKPKQNEHSNVALLMLSLGDLNLEEQLLLRSKNSSTLISTLRSATKLDPASSLFLEVVCWCPSLPPFQAIPGFISEKLHQRGSLTRLSHGIEQFLLSEFGLMHSDYSWLWEGMMGMVSAG